MRNIDIVDLLFHQQLLFTDKDVLEEVFID